jgi:hypothetical protein
MGCFSASCCITRTEISAGEPVFVAFVKPTYRSGGIKKFTTSSILSLSHFNELQWTANQSCGEFVYISVEDYDDYGCVNSHVEEQIDPYGIWWDFQFIAHKSVCETLLGRELGEGIQLEKDFFELLHMCHMARIEVYHDLLGPQHLMTRELELQELVHKETGRILEIKKQQLEEFENDF